MFATINRERREKKAPFVSTGVVFTGLSGGLGLVQRFGHFRPVGSPYRRLRACGEGGSRGPLGEPKFGASVYRMGGLAVGGCTGLTVSLIKPRSYLHGGIFDGRG